MCPPAPGWSSAQRSWLCQTHSLLPPSTFSNWPATGSGRDYPSWLRDGTLEVVPEPTVAAAEAAARKVLDTRIAAVRTLAETRAALSRARTALTEAEKTDTATWAATLRAGWTVTELRKVGFEPPTRRGPGRPRNTAALSDTATV